MSWNQCCCDCCLCDSLFSASTCNEWKHTLQKHEEEEEEKKREEEEKHDGLENYVGEHVKMNNFEGKSNYL